MYSLRTPRAIDNADLHFLRHVQIESCTGTGATPEAFSTHRLGTLINVVETLSISFPTPNMHNKIGNYRDVQKSHQHFRNASVLCQFVDF